MMTTIAIEDGPNNSSQRRLHSPLVKHHNKHRRRRAKLVVDTKYKAYDPNALAKPKGFYAHLADIIKSLVYGGFDGIISTFAIISGAHGSSMTNGVIIAIAMSGIIGGSLSMCLGDYLSTRSIKDLHERKRTKREKRIQEQPEKEREKIADLFRKRGIQHRHAIKLSALITKYKKVWIDYRMVDEEGCIEITKSPLKNALTTFFSFLIFSTMPLIPYFVSFNSKSSDMLFYESIGVTAILLVLLGVIKSRVDGTNLFRSALETLSIGAAVAGAAFLIGYLLEDVHKTPVASFFR